MNESEMLISRKRLFKNKKYIIMISKEKGETITGGTIKKAIKKQVKTHNGVVEAVSKRLTSFFDKIFKSKIVQVENLTENRINKLSNEIDKLDLNLQQYQDLWIQMDLLTK